MDTVKVFDTLERKIERSCWAPQIARVETENEVQVGSLVAARKAEKDAGDSKGVVERLEREQEIVRERLEKLIQALEAAEEKKSLRCRG